MTLPTRLLTLLVLTTSCAHGQASATPPPPPAASTAPTAQEIPAPGDSLPTVRRKLGDGVIERQVSPTEAILSALYGGPCPDLPSGPGDLSRPASGAGKVLTVRLSAGRAVVVEWGNPQAPATGADK